MEKSLPKLIFHIKNMTLFKAIFEHFFGVILVLNALFNCYMSLNLDIQTSALRDHLFTDVEHN